MNDLVVLVKTVMVLNIFYVILFGIIIELCCETSLNGEEALARVLFLYVYHKLSLCNPQAIAAPFELSAFP